ncbi:hypothetical protein WNY61_07875 [Sulfitobacter sp. AS92]|uniref:hypothetical protein n=1 Tax=Sulfitobacter sp. AS92 TaxID=3135783 RepID=UPI00317CF690
MTHKQPSLNLAELRARIENGTVATSSKPSILAFLDLANLVIGPEAFCNPAVLESPASFSKWFPSAPDENIVKAYGDAAMYDRCRDSIQRHVRLAGVWPDEDPFSLLNQLAREYRINGVNRKLIEAVLPGVTLRSVTREKAVAADRGLRGNERNALRNSFSSIDQLRDDPRVIAAGILNREMIGPMPLYRDGDKLPITLPVTLAAVLPHIDTHNARRARRAFELAVDVGLFKQDGPASGWTLTINDAVRYHRQMAATISANSAALYLRALITVLSAARPQSVPEDVTANRVLSPKRYATDTKAPPKKQQETPVILPACIEAEIAEFSKDRSTSPRRVRELRRLLFELQEAGIDINGVNAYDCAVDVFKVRFSNRAELTLRSYRTTLHTFLAHTNRLAPWECLISRARISKGQDVNLSGLLLVRKYAESVEPEIAPARIDIDVARRFLLRAQESGDVSRCLAGFGALDALRQEHLGLLPGSAIGDQQPWLRCAKGELPLALKNDLNSDAEAAGYGEFGIKELIVAARRLYALTTDKSIFNDPFDVIPWRKLTMEADANYPQEMAYYRTALLRLADRVDRELTPGWHALQAEIAECGIPRAENPVDTLFDVASKSHLEPWQLDREWAWMHERSLRPDLRRKWNRAIANFDTLRGVEEIFRRKLLPTERVGPMPKIGARLKNAYFPLPRRVEAALEGETKQVLEAAHFVWRCLRDFGVFSRGDDPAPYDLFAETNLERILQEQTFMTRSSAKIHGEQIRDWCRAWPGNTA